MVLPAEPPEVRCVYHQQTVALRWLREDFAGDLAIGHDCSDGMTGVGVSELGNCGCRQGPTPCVSDTSFSRDVLSQCPALLLRDQWSCTLRAYAFNTWNEQPG